MKPKLFLLLMLLYVATNYAQTSASVKGVSIQGIAYDNIHAGRVEGITLDFFVRTENTVKRPLISTVNHIIKS
jgi:hypothetical protein